jgi:hypothetical protein
MTGVILVAKKSGMIYELLEVDGDRIHLINLTNGKDGWLEKEDTDKLVVNMALTSMQESNPILKELIKELSLCHERE